VAISRTAIRTRQSALSRHRSWLPQNYESAGQRKSIHRDGTSAPPSASPQRHRLCHDLLIGKGDSVEDLVRLPGEYGLTDVVAMTGRIPWRDVIASLRATDSCVQPDSHGFLNDHSTMNKLMDYTALGRVVVSYDLAETRVSGGDAVLYVQGNRAGPINGPSSAQII
jgi:hypothetical protein